MKKWALYTIILVLVIAILILITKKLMKQLFLMPVTGRISSGFGYRIDPLTNQGSGHNGIDIAVPIDTPVLAPMDGEVISRYSNSLGGVQLIVKHPNGWKTGYAHLNKYGNFKVGDTFKQGDVIAYTGNSGSHTTGAHLHFTLTDPKGTKRDPEHYFNKELILTV